MIATCRDSHAGCTARSMPNLPRRVLDVGELAYGGIVKLRETNTGELGDYATLSYCWGVSQKLVTTKETVQAHMIGLDDSSLPLTILDAVKVTRALRLRYLWVDALCIIQDDKDDKNSEISVMGGIYANATITIAAGAATKASDGFLVRKELAQLPVYVDENTRGSILLYRHQERQLTRLALTTRCWTLQEMELSPRVLFINEGIITWHCGTIATSAPPGRLQSPYHGRLMRTPTFTKDLVQCDDQARRALLQAWRMTIEDYSGRRLSVMEDRLPAIAGISERVANALSDTYLAGLWQQNILRWLMWEQNPRERHPSERNRLPNASRTENCHGPTWSWSSHYFEIMYIFGDEFYDVASFIDCSIELASDLLPYGRVRSGVLHLRAKLTRVMDVNPFTHMDCDMSLDYTWTLPDINTSPDYTWEQPDPTIVWALIGQYDWYSGGKRICGLVLQPSAGGRFKRIGVFHDRLDLAHYWDAVQEQDIFIE